MRKIVFLLALTLHAAEHRGVVRFSGLPVPGASVTASRGAEKQETVTGTQGQYVFAGLSEGSWTLQVEMQLFETQRREIAVEAGAPPAEWELKALPASAATAVVTKPFQRTEVDGRVTRRDGPIAEAAVPREVAERAADGFLINGSVNNGASSPFALLPAFGNNRRGQRSMYNGNLGFIWNNSSFDARPYSLTGQESPKPGYNRMQGLIAFGGPLRIPRVLDRRGPMFTLNYQWTRNATATTQTGLMPTASERAGDLSGMTAQALDPQTGAPFPGNRIPASRISAQARALLSLFPLPNFTASNRYNFQTPVVSGFHQDDLQARANKQIRRQFLSGSFAWQSTRTSNPDLFGLLDTGESAGLNASAGYRRAFTMRSFVNLGVQYSRQTNRMKPFFAGRRNISGEAGVTGNNQEPVNWGPPTLLFNSGFSALTQPQAADNRNQTAGFSVDGFLNRGRHYWTYGYNHRRQQFNLLSQQDARGVFTFNGASAGNDFAGFLLGIPDTSSIAYGNADKYLRSKIQELFLNDDWRVNPGLTVNAGVRWEYWSPMQEKYGRLVNLDVAPGFVSAKASTTLPAADRNNFAPRIGFSWRPFAASSMVVRGGYGIYYDTSVYLPVATRMSQQAPLSRSLRVANTPETPLTLANGFPADVSGTDATTFGVAPSLRIGFSQNWQLSIQRDLPGALQLVATYDGSKGLRAQQQILPNTYPSTAVAPSGFTWLISDGQSIRHSGQVQLRRRLRSGFTANVSYTWAKSIDDAALGGRGQAATLLAQNWLAPQAERALSNFDQRHMTSAMATYTTGMGLRGGALANGRLATLLRDWTFGTQLTAGSGLPLTPILPRLVPGTGVSGILRPDYTGADVYAASGGIHLNPAAWSIPQSGQWGNAGRNTITGPAQFSMGASLARTFRSSERISYDFRLEAANVLNTVTYPSWNTVIGNAQFGLPNSANPMRSVQAIFRARF